MPQRALSSAGLSDFSPSALIGDQLMGQDQRQDMQQRQIERNQAEIARLRREIQRLQLETDRLRER
jgi:hypothetical protein